jgi:hypothetical protein
MSQITLDKTDARYSEAIADCAVGKEKVITITVMPSEVTETEVTGEITAAEYSEPVEMAPPVEAATENPAVQGLIAP